MHEEVGTRYSEICEYQLPYLFPQFRGTVATSLAFKMADQRQEKSDTVSPLAREGRTNSVDSGTSAYESAIGSEADLAGHAPVKQLDVDDVLTICGTGLYQRRLLLVTGLAFAADSIEVSFLAFLSPCAQVDFDLTNFEAATVASVVFMAELLGAATLGPAADTHGRRFVFLVTSAVIFFAGIMSCLGFLLTGVLPGALRDRHRGPVGALFAHGRAH